MNHYEHATHLLAEGKIEDAFITFISIVELCAKQLHQVQFLHQHIVNRPLEYQNSIDLIRKSTDGLEKIIVYKPPIPPRPEKINATRLKNENPVSFVDDDDEEDEMIDLEIEFVKQPKKSSQLTTMDNILFEAIIDPSNLVPAQTHTSDSLSISVSSLDADYIPNIPVPPLLAIYRQLQQKEDQNNTTLLPKIRSLYMSAVTIPTMMEFPANLFAYQLTLIESAIFRAIPREALLSHITRKPQLRIVASTDFFNFITRTIEHSILLPQDVCRRAEILNRWIKLASKLLALSNYQTLKAVISALGTPPIQRLRRTWECIPKKQMNRLDLLISLMSESQNYYQYRQRVKTHTNRPAVPFLGVFIHDITYMSAASKDNTRIQSALDDLERFQRLPEYPQQPPSSFVIKKHLFRSVPDVLHFSSKGTTSAAACMVSEEECQTEDKIIGLEQQLIVQYVLMRPWVSEKTIDMLSQLREPTKRRLSVTPTVSANRWVNSSEEMEENKKSLSGFWPFKKNSAIISESTCNEEEEKKEEETSLANMLNPKKLSFSTKKSNHRRSLSLPSKSEIGLQASFNATSPPPMKKSPFSPDTSPTPPPPTFGRPMTTAAAAAAAIKKSSMPHRRQSSSSSTIPSRQGSVETEREESVPREEEKQPQKDTTIDAEAEDDEKEEVVVDMDTHMQAQMEKTKEDMKVLLENFSPEQLQRYEAYRRSALNRTNVKRVRSV
ncbi:hypothetical protein G6F62_008363 [Rhizopus arrhizus]|nr:hypothetical protein G6F62_008363 [Rhizopus arrhizus]KAG1405224.1 hypothetical protein G6F58_010050 [Rhizopus delemar]